MQYRTFGKSVFKNWVRNFGNPVQLKDDTKKLLDRFD